MLFEDKEVSIEIKRTEPKKTGGKDEKQTNLMEESKKKEEQEPSKVEVCNSSWITHLILTNYQMLSSVRDYIVPGDRIKSLLKNYPGQKNDSQRKYLIRIRTKGF